MRAGEELDAKALLRILNDHNKRLDANAPHYSKKKLLPFYLRTKERDPQRWQSWNITPELEQQLVHLLQVKPRRSASGVATITVITKPWKCGGACIYCPNDLRMPKSYLSDEPACQRAERNYFDPYLQVTSRLRALNQMGHVTDKIELIVLGGTWSDYPQGYQTWFMSELFRALNDDAVAGVAANPMLARPGISRAEAERLLDDAPADALPPVVAERRERYRAAGIATDEVELAAGVADEQGRVDAVVGGYNRAVRRLYGPGTPWGEAAEWQTATMEELERQQRINEMAKHRVVGLVIETRPDAVTPQALTLIRRLGCTKIQMGIQSLDQHLLDINERRISVAQIERAFSLARLFGFKIHAHFMLNLLGATPEGDKRDYERFMTEGAFMPDEVKVYPCALIEGSRLVGRYERGEWRPYTEEELLDVLADDIVVTPAFCRISRMIRDFSSDDIMVGNKKPNLRQLVENRLAARGDGATVREIRYREISTAGADLDELSLDEVAYETPVTRERFLQLVTPEGKIAGFLRLSLPVRAFVAAHADELPTMPDEAMIREVHVYGMAARVGDQGQAAQHHGLGRSLVERACHIARDAGYARINVISAIGTREYYRHLGFYDYGLYLQKEL